MRERPPRRPLLSRERIVEAAAALVDAEGLDALSTRRLAAELGVRGPSLYNHFATKDEILDAVADAVIAQVDVSFFATHDWREALRLWGTVLPRRRSPPTRTSCPYLAQGPGRRPAALAMADAVYGGLVDGGLAAGARHPHRRADALLRRRLGARLVRPRLRRGPRALRRRTTRTSTRPTGSPSTSRASTRARSRSAWTRSSTASTGSTGTRAMVH